MLDTKFPRLFGDIGNPASFRDPPKYLCVCGATVDTIVTSATVEDSLVQSTIQAAQLLQEDNVDVIGTSCGFFSSIQKQVQEAISVPFISSSLILIPFLKTIFGTDAKIGVLTFDESKLGSSHLNSESRSQLFVHGLDPDGELFNCVASNRMEMNKSLAEKDAMAVAERCIRANPDVEVLLLECTNLSPWKNRMKSEFSLPVFDLVDALEWVDRACTLD